MTDPKDYTSRGWMACAALIAVLVVVGFIPPQQVGGIALRRANILSDIVTFDDAPATDEPLLADEIELPDIDWEQADETVVPLGDTVSPGRERTIVFEWCAADDAPDTAAPADTLLAEWPAAEPPRVAIEDFDTTDSGPLKAFYRKLAERQPVRIAFLGDSFVEGDILTADLREAMQGFFGGSGAGFAPMASPLTGFRRTVKTRSAGWTAYNIMQRTNAPADIRELFIVSGWTCRPADGASTRWEMTDAREHLCSAERARVWFRSANDSRIELIVNDSLQRTFDAEGDESLREIVVRHPDLRSLECRVVSGAGGFVGYGACFEGAGGVTVDNYSIRSNNGRALFWTSPVLNAQLQALAPYDLVVLQYGLNIMQQGVSDYSKYAEQVRQMIAYVRRCFPDAAVLVLGVSDRSVKSDSGFEPMDAIPSLTRWQRTAAEQSGAAFWSTAEAMQALGGMAHFVAQGWAGKDYTHINYGGGRQIALALFEAIRAGAAETAAELRTERLQREELEPVLDSAAVDSLLFNRTIEIR